MQKTQLCVNWIRDIVHCMYMILDHRSIYKLLISGLSSGIVVVCTLLNNTWECFGLSYLHIYSIGWAKTKKIEAVEIKA